jgi:uncharacterized protein with GYD domain
MPKYVALLSWTDQGIRNAKDTINRANAARKAFQSVGGKITDIYWTIGPYDVVVIFEAPDSDTAYRIMLQTGMQGNVRTVTMPAMDEQAMATIIQGI